MFSHIIVQAQIPTSLITIHQEETITHTQAKEDIAVGKYSERYGGVSLRQKLRKYNEFMAEDEKLQGYLLLRYFHILT